MGKELMTNIYKVALVGAGQIGSRHLQGMAKCRLPLEIVVVDPSKESLKIAQERFEQVEAEEGVNVRFSNSIIDIAEKSDLAIVATNSNIRRLVVEELLNTKKISNLVLEKVAFQTVEDFESVISLLKEKGTRAWVNCPRRMYPFYQELKNQISKSCEEIAVTVEGGGWCLGSNSIHFLDLFSYLSGQTDIQLDRSLLNSEVHESKRNEYLEVSGALQGRAIDGSAVTLRDLHDVKSPVTVTIFSKTNRYIVFEGEGRALKLDEKNPSKWQEVSFKMPFQSELTNILIENILQEGTCKLASLEESFEIHRPLISTLNDHFFKTINRESPICPIS